MKYLNIKVILISALLTIVFIVVVILNFSPQTTQIVQKSDNVNNMTNEPEKIDREVVERKFSGFKTNTAKYSVNPELLLSGGPGKDGIPAIMDPKFVSINNTNIGEDVQGILVSFDGEKRYYPYNILVWHEIVNDSIGDNHYLVTFCPLCGSAIVFNRVVDENLLDFGVSGFLYESNLVMYDRQTESLWSQSRGESIIGEQTGTKLELVDMQLISFAELKKKHPEAKVLSDDTGYRRDYSFYPYGGYEDNEDLLFPVSVTDKRFNAKEIMYITPYKDKSIALSIQSLNKDKIDTFQFNGETLEVKLDGEEIIVSVDGNKLPGYYEMWFSWATHHQENGLVWNINN